MMRMYLSFHGLCPPTFFVPCLVFVSYFHPLYFHPLLSLCSSSPLKLRLEMKTNERQGKYSERRTESTRQRRGDYRKTSMGARQSQESLRRNDHPQDNNISPIATKHQHNDKTRQDKSRRDKTRQGRMMIKIQKKTNSSLRLPLCISLCLCQAWKI